MGGKVKLPVSLNSSKCHKAENRYTYIGGYWRNDILEVRHLYGIFSKFSSTSQSYFPQQNGSFSRFMKYSCCCIQFYCLLCFSTTTVTRLHRKFSFLLENPWPRLRNCFFLFFACILQRICIHHEHRVAHRTKTNEIKGTKRRIA